MSKRNGDYLEIAEIPNWDRYNPRSDRGGYAWFRMDNQFFLHMRERKGLSAVGTHLMAFLLAEYSSAGSRPFRLRFDYIAKMEDRSIAQIRAAVDELVASGEITLKSSTHADTDLEQDVAVLQCDVDVKPLDAACTLTNERTNDVHVGSSGGFDLESVYRRYPKRGRETGKKAGMKKLRSQITSPDKYAEFVIAVGNYADHVAREKRKDPKWNYIKMWSTFCASDCWPDWLEAEAEGVSGGSTVNVVYADPGAQDVLL